MNLKEIQKEALKKIKPSEGELLKLKKEADEFCSYLDILMKKKRIRGDIFIGGSLAKNTIIKKKKYDADIFLRFDRKYSENEVKKHFEDICTSIRLRSEKIHGSRDYWRFFGESMFFEIIPVYKISRPEQAVNTTDLSFFHVEYILNKIKKNKRLPDEIILAKAFVYANECYGAESHITGFSGYSIELLVSHYKSFLNFIKAIAGAKERLILDPARHYKSKFNILENVNESKIDGPAILIDPTYKYRNVLSALSISTFDKFKKACQDFLKHPSLSFFEKKTIDEASLLREAKKKKADFHKVILKTEKQEGSIAGSKLLKFYNVMCMNLEKYCDILNKHFVYDDGKEAIVYFILRKKKFLLFHGPPVSSKEHSENFKKKHKYVYEERGRLFAKTENIFNMSDLPRILHDVLQKMSISEMKVI